MRVMKTVHSARAARFIHVEVADADDAIIGRAVINLEDISSCQQACDKCDLWPLPEYIKKR